MPVITNVDPVIMPALCSNACQFHLKRPLYVKRIHITMPETVIVVYKRLRNVTCSHPCKPAIKK